MSNNEFTTKRIALLDTSIMSYNIGDKIIMESARKQLESVTKNSFVVDMPTKTPIFHWYEFSLRNEDIYKRNLKCFDYKFICGTNLLEKNMKIRKPAWNLHMGDLRYINDFILVGVGTDSKEIVPNNYTKRFYRSALTSSFKHSVRDEKARLFLKGMGIDALNTGCVTLWSLDENHCLQIPKKKSSNVIITLTDYAQNPELDKKMIQIIMRSYDSVYFWVQGFHDMEYLVKLCSTDELNKIRIVPPSLDAYNEILTCLDCDYIGTRLHAGIKAMQKKKRSIIVGVDDRAEDMHNDYHFNYVSRNNIEFIEEYLHSSFSTQIELNNDAINEFVNQFK